MLKVIPDFFFRLNNTRAMEQQRAFLRIAPEARGTAITSDSGANQNAKHMQAALEACLLKTMTEDTDPVADDPADESPLAEQPQAADEASSAEESWLETSEHALDSDDIAMHLHGFATPISPDLPPSSSPDQIGRAHV